MKSLVQKSKLTYIIDDDEIYVYSIKKLLQIKNLCSDFLVFGNGKLAIDYIKNNTKNTDILPDVILLDINMPILDGWGFLDQFADIQNNIQKEIAIFIVSSSINPEDINKAKEYTFVKKYMVKPIDLKSLTTIFTLSE